MNSRDPETTQWQDLRETWNAEPARARIDPSTLRALQRRVRRYRLLWWLEGAVALCGILLASMLAWQGRIASTAGLVVAALLLMATGLACWTALNRRTAAKMGDQGSEGVLMAAAGATRASIRFWYVNRTLTWLAGFAFCVFVLARMASEAHLEPAILAYAPLLIAPLCLASDILMRSRLRRLGSRLDHLQGLLVDLHR